ncbi:NACHT domain-containing protein [Shewanella corallii]|uniref:NACHT domain-containing protein n=1 Tax=Shewanella corallii TaxID=560080 RepID=A0ABT0N9U7_9GAMM|nr:NACHT domain-containing protein [Shewanella corallii]MCL2915234.1 NACHT domain-containing protein [Shewanella corallii]
MQADKIMEGPIKKSTTSVFDTINKKAEALDIFNRYEKANNSYVKAQVENIQILGMSEPVKLADIYSTTMISTSIHRRLYSTEWAELDSQKRNKKIGKYKSTTRADDFIEKENRIVVLAGPGAGKTTLMKYTALSYIDNETFEKSNFKTKKTPFFISLPELADTELSVIEFISERIKIKTHEYAIEYVKRKLNKGEAIVLFDSLDEVSNEHRDRIFKIIEDFSKCYETTKIIVTCRVADYNRTIEGFFEIEIARLTEKAINKIIRAWFKGSPKKARELIGHLSVDKDVYSLTETPLLLSLLCIQYANDLNIPNRKTELYSRCVDALIRLWDTSRGFRRATAFSALTDDRKEKLFSDVAYKFLCRKEGKYIFHEKELTLVISDFIQKYAMERTLAKEIINEIESHHGIIEKFSAESYSFSHVSFQEYFAAMAVVAKRKELDFVKENLTNLKAASIIIFMVSLMDDPSPILKLLMQRSDLSGITNYPAMSKRTELLSLLYRCMNSGVCIEPELRNKIYVHIAYSQIEISKIYSKATTYPIAKLEGDGVRHMFFYIGKTRKTLSAALLSYRKLSNEILLSPNMSYSDVAFAIIDKYKVNNEPNSKIIETSVKTCLLVPLVGANPKRVLKKLQELNVTNKEDSLLAKIGEDNMKTIVDSYIDNAQ